MIKSCIGTTQKFIKNVRKSIALVDIKSYINYRIDKDIFI